MKTAKGSHTQTAVSDLTFDNKKEVSKPAIILPSKLWSILCQDIFVKVIQLKVHLGVTRDMIP